MKKLGTLLALSLVTSQAFSGEILPDLSRTKSEPNTSPVAVAFSNRDSANAYFAKSWATAETAGTDVYDQDIKNLGASLFTSKTKYHMEFTFGLVNDEVETLATNTGTSTNTYDFSASVGTAFSENFVAGLSASMNHISELNGGTKVNNDIWEITPAVGFKFQPNMAVGFGVHQRFNRAKVIAVGSSFTELPALATSEIFAGIAYGVDQKIGENGFGVEAVVSHTPESKETEGTVTISQGSSTKFQVDGNYTMDMLDLGAEATYITGDNYADTASRKTQIYAVRPEYLVTSTMYVAPQASYINVKNTSDSGADGSDTTKGWSYGTGVGMRTAAYDLELTYLHGAYDTTTGNAELDSNQVAARVSYYF